MARVASRSGMMRTRLTTIRSNCCSKGFASKSCSKNWIFLMSCCSAFKRACPAFPEMSTRVTDLACLARGKLIDLSHHRNPEFLCLIEEQSVFQLLDKPNLQGRYFRGIKGFCFVVKIMFLFSLDKEVD